MPGSPGSEKTDPIRELIEQALRDWAAPRFVDASGLAHAVLHDLRIAGYVIVKADRMREALTMIATIGEGSTTANSLPHIAKIARRALDGD